MISESGSHKIGIFDSGVGGLSVMREIQKSIPSAPLIYFADQAHIPYGEKSLPDILHYAREITRYLLEQGAEMIVVACNTASAAALKTLRMDNPQVPFVGMEPAVKPASQQTNSHVVGVLATPATFQGDLYATLVERFAKEVTLMAGTPPGLVEAIERGELDSPLTRCVLEEALAPMLAAGADTIVLGCTHYPFVLPLIRQITGEQVNVIDPAPAIARRVASLVNEYHWQYPQIPSEIIYATSAEGRRFAEMLQALLGLTAAPIELTWHPHSQHLTEKRIS